MKKVWIASIFATLMLTVPLTSVVGANEVEDCNCNPVSNLEVVRIERLLTRLESRINFILLKYAHIPEVAEKCQIISENISILKELKEGLNPVLPFQDIPPICYILIPLFIILMTLVEWFPHSEIPILKQIIDLFQYWNIYHC